MGKVLVTIRAMPDGVETDMDAIQEAVKALDYQVNSTDIEPIAFGLKALIAKFVVDDTAGVADAISEEIKKIPGVKDAEVTEVTLVS